MTTNVALGAAIDRLLDRHRRTSGPAVRRTRDGITLAHRTMSLSMARSMAAALASLVEFRGKEPEVYHRDLGAIPWELALDLAGRLWTAALLDVQEQGYEGYYSLECLECETEGAPLPDLMAPDLGVSTAG